MRDENGRMVKARQGRWMFHRQALLSVLAMFAVSASSRRHPRSVPTIATRAPRRAAASMRRCASSNRRLRHPPAAEAAASWRYQGRRWSAGAPDARHNRAHPHRHSVFPRPRSQARRRHRRGGHRRSGRLGSLSAARSRLSTWSRCATSTPRRVSPTGVPFVPTRSSSAMSHVATMAVVVAEFRLWDVASGRQLAGQRFATSAQNWRRVGRIIADQVYKQLDAANPGTSTRVWCSSTRRALRIAASNASPSWIRMASMCGCSTQGQELVLTPRFSPTNRGDHLHVVHRRSAARVPHEPGESDSVEIVGDFPGMTFAPRFSPGRPARRHEPRQAAATHRSYEMDLRSPPDSAGSLQARHRYRAPATVPMARSIGSNRSRRHPAIYVMNADGSARIASAAARGAIRRLCGRRAAT